MKTVISLLCLCAFFVVSQRAADAASCVYRCPTPAYWKRIPGDSPWYGAGVRAQQGTAWRTPSGNACLQGSANCFSSYCEDATTLVPCTPGAANCTCRDVTSDKNTALNATINWSSNPPSPQCRKWCSEYPTSALRATCAATSAVGNGCEHDVYTKPTTCFAYGACT